MSLAWKDIFYSYKKYWMHGSWIVNEAMTKEAKKEHKRKGVREKIFPNLDLDDVRHASHQNQLIHGQAR